MICASLPFAGELRLAGDHVEQGLLQGEGRMQQLLHAQGLAHADQLVEQLGHVLAKRLVGGQQAVVGVQAGVAGVVVAGAEVRVAAQLAVLAAGSASSWRGS